MVNSNNFVEKFKQIEQDTLTDEEDGSSLRIVNRFPTENIAGDGLYRFDKSARKKAKEYTHNLHDFPAKYIPIIPRWAFEYSELEKGESSVFDPFCGSGTVLVEGRRFGMDSYGIDINPLARMISKTSATPLFVENPKLLDKTIDEFEENLPHNFPDVELDPSLEDVQLHQTWDYWFSEEVMKNIIGIKRRIRSFCPSFLHENEKYTELLRNFFLVNLSSIIKKISYLREDQIKVYRDKEKYEKGVPNPSKLLLKTLRDNSPAMKRFSKECSKFPNADVKVIGEDAKNYTLNEKVDLIITSPPYLNAIDYGMATKYNMFALDLLEPGEYRNHCMNYVGITERAPNKSEYKKKQLYGREMVDKFVREIHKEDTVRSYVVGKYFKDMKKILENIYENLKPGKFCIMILGSNNIRGNFIPTHEITRKIAIEDIEPNCGGKFEHVTKFYHVYKGKKLTIKRKETGGTIDKEMVFILKKPI